MPQVWTDEAGTLHEQYRALVFLRGDFAGEFSFDPGDHPELRYRRTGAAYFCPFCGDIWARVVLYDSAGRQAFLEPERVSCETHPDDWNVAGSLLAPGLTALLDLLPKPLVQREFAIHLRKISK